MLPFFLPLTYTFITHSALKLGTRYGCHTDNSLMKYESICCNIYDTEGFGYILVSALLAFCILQYFCITDLCLQ